MSVINKVLRDLDQRAAGGGPTAVDGPPTADGERMPAGVVPVAVLPTTSPQVHARRGWQVPVLLVSVLAIGAALWWWRGPGHADTLAADAGANAVQKSVPATPSAAAPRVDAAPVPAPQPASASSPAATPVAAASGALVPSGSAGPDVPTPVPPSVPVPPPPAAPQVATSVAVAAPAGVASGVPPGVVRQAQPSVPAPPASAAYRVAAATPAAAPVPKPVEPEAPPVAVPAPVPWPDAALEAVGQAQRMWNSGARETALAFLRDALAGVERVHGAELVPDRAGAAAGLAMVRELVRMEQVMANHAQVLALLKRHEVLWARQADLWAVRGSAAQRLSQHAEAADAYRAALRLRPGEPRWMLGAAVSLAALGRPAEAAPLAEQARRSGPVSPEVLSYLRQLGVTLASDNPGN